MDHHNSLGVEHFTVGWICGLPVELTAAAELLDEEYPPLRIADDNLYTFGRIGDHNVVIACLPTGQNGASSAATVTQIKDKFPSIRFGLIVGTGSGVPSTEHDIRLGDIVVSQPVQGYGGVVQYEYNTLAGRELHRYESLKAPPPVLLQALSKIQANHMRGTIRFKDYLRVAERLHVGHCDDILFKATYSHAGGPTCEDCSEKELESRTIRRNKDVIVHYGTIASSNQIIRDALTRDGLASRLGGVLCFDTDAAGLMNDFPCIVVRGICDYADSHRYGTWQAYAAATAAAYAKELLGVIPAKSEGTTYRVSRIPDTYSADSFHDALRISLHLKPHTTLIIHSFASDWLQRRTATITFSDTPSKLYSAGADNAGGKTTEWRVNIVHPLSIQSDTVCIDRHFTGFTPVSPLDNDVEHLVDCIAIHGWGSHALGGFKAHDDTYVWLRDSLTKDVPRLRVFIYGYACDLTTADSISTVDDYADTLRRLLRDMRSQKKTAPPVPLVFIAHSLGGIVLKQALIRMKESSDSDDNCNLNSVYGALFFGVPSHGMDTEALAAMVKSEPQRYNLSLLNQEVGHQLQSPQYEDFYKPFDFEDLKIIQFVEMRKTPTVVEDQVTNQWKRARPETLLVNPASATCGRLWETTDDFKVFIDADHSDMVKFPRFDQDGYIKARDRLQKFAEQAILVMKERLSQRSIKKPSLRQDGLVLDKTSGPEDLGCLRSLAFPEMNHRRQDIQRPHAKTCAWITRHPLYITWLKEGSGILWIKGRPGSGKSTLMEFLLREFEKQALYQESIQLSFFLHGQGTILQKSRLGMYRSLLHQLLLSAPTAQAEFRHAFQERSTSQGDPGKDWSWHTNELRAFFITAIEHVTKTRPVNIFVDALDEANDGPDDQNSMHQIVSDFHEISDLLRRKELQCTICFSCRHFPMVAGNQGRDIYIENENLADISVYVCDELHRRLSMTEIEKQYLLELQDTIVEGSQGVFQWAVVAVPLAVRCYYEGSLPSEIRQVLAGVPRGLWDVYEHILGEVIDKRYYQQTLRLMRCVSLSERPLTVTEVCFAMSLQDSEIFDSESAFAELEIPTHNVMVRRIISLSGGLIEAKQHEKGQILQFIHPSVKDFLVRDGLGFLDMTSRSKAIGQGHHQLSLICANYIRIAKIDNLDKSDAQSVKAQLPFVDYATKYWFLHAEKAEIRGLPQDYLIRYSQYYPRILEHWVRFYTILDYYNYSGRRPEKSSTILHIASSASLLSVVEGLLSTHPDLEQMDSSGNRALHYACRWGHTKLVKVLLDAGAMVEAENSSKCTALERAAANGHEEVVELLVEKRAEINKQTGYTGNALYGAAAKGSTTIVRRLLDHKANANAQGGQYGNALQAAACEGHQAVVQLLLDSGAEVNAQGGQYGNALQGAAYRGDQAIVQLLLDNKADINAQGGQYGNALQAAASKGYQAIVQLLLDNKADINAQGGEYGNALQAAASKGYQAIVELLLGDETSLSDSSEAISVASDASAIFSTVASLSSKSSISSIIHEAIEQFARIIIGEEDLKDKYEIAVSRCTEERFLRNHKRLLKRYFLDLTAEVETDVQRHAVRALRGSLQRAQVSSKVYASFSQRNVAERERMRALSAQDIDRTENLKTYLQSLPGHSEGGVETHGEIALNTKDQDDARSQSSSSGSENEDPVKESEALSLNELKKIVGFLIRGSSFQRFKEKLHQFVYPPSTIREALATKDIRVLEKVLTKNFDRATQDEYSWLREIQAIGYSIRNIAELLFEHTNDTPWIFFEPQPTIGLKIKHGFHRPSCAHSSDQNTAGCRAHSGNQSETLDISSSIGVIETESFLRSVQESCGLAGIVPISRDRRTWRGRVNFQDDNSTSYVSYGSTGEEEVDGRSLVFCIYQALRGFCEAVSYVQDGACCCDCYTILRITTRDCLPDVVDMVRVHFELVGQLESEMQRLSLSDDIDHLQCIKCGTIAGQILSILGVPFDSGDKDVEHKAENLDGDQIGEMLHRCCLAVQFLCLSFLSYSQAHCGTIQPFFLDTPQRKVVLRGSKMGAADSWQIETQLVDLTCIGEMIQDSVVVFSASNKSNIQLDLPQGLVFDLMACPEDLIDTWGPGEFIGRMSEIGNNLLCAVVIGGGIIQAAGTEDKKFHWSRDAIHGTSDASPIEPNMKLLVGAAVRVNNNCPMDETQFCLNSEEQLENLGTFEGYWETAERQVGIQTGQYVNLAFLQTWEKIPTRTMKKTQLALPDNHLLPFLQSSWGLQFSCCTGIARRVSLCELIADVMPAFVESLLPIPRLWESLKKDHNIIQAFRHDDLQTWLGNLSDECQQLVAGIVRYILSVMAHTGVDSKGKNFTVAWVRKKNPFQCFKLSCQKKNYWTRILADSGDCATFAYVGSKCLVTSSLECRGLISMWRNESTLLETAVCRHKPNLPRTGLHSTPCILQHEDYYSMGRPDALLWVKVDRGELHANPRLLVYPSIIPTAIAIRLLSKRFSNSMQTLQRLRERQSKDGQAESVVVLSAA